MQTALEDKKVESQFVSDPLFSVIVPVYDLPVEVFKRCLNSIEKQDYENKEVILVFDGPNDELRKLADYYLKRNENWAVLEIPHAGACAARNAGFEASKGEIVSFINSDYNLKPGIIRLWVDRLQDNPDCGFVYGGYEYNTSPKQVYPSKAFDPYLLEIANFIDCGFPLWRKYFVPWDVNCKSLQDWDFWLRVMKTHNVKGYFLEDTSFIAEPPRPKGLSMDSSKNWIDRVRYVKEKNGIPLRDLVVTSLGAPIHGVQIAKMIGADYRDDTIYKPNNYKAVYMIGFYIRPDQANNEHGPILSSFPKEVKKIIHWVGADIYWLRKFSYENLKALGGALKLTAIHLVENETARKELKDLLNIDAKVVPIPPYTDLEPKPLPEKFKVAIFITQKSDFDKYLLEHTLSLVRACPDIQFSAYGDAANGHLQYPNLQCVGNLPKDKWQEYVYDNSCLIRICKHDTTPLASNEFMMAGRYVISNLKGECTHYVDTSGDSIINDWDNYYPGVNVYRWPETKTKIIQKIRAIARIKEPYLNPNLKQRFNKDNYINTIYEIADIARPK